MTKENILDDFLDCNTCADISGTQKRRYDRGLSERKKIDKLMEVLPGIDYIRNQMLNYIFSNGLTTGSINADVILNDFLYRKNNADATNYSVLREAIGWAAIDGECGIRLYDGNIYLVRSGQYAIVKGRVDGIEQIFGYLVSTSDNVYLYDMDEESFEKWWKRDDVLFLDKTEFCQIRNNVSFLHGKSPLLSDKLRIDLLVTAYERLNYDVEYDGPGRIIIRPKDGYINGDPSNDISTSTVINTSGVAQMDRAEKAKREAARLAKEIRDSTSDSVIVLSNGFDEHIEHLERVTKATEFFTWLNNEGVILAQAMGMAPSLLELGKISGNVSMEKIIDNGMLNNIVPLREHYAIQFSEFISNYLGIQKVYFDKYDLQQSEDENETRMKIVDMMVKLASIGEEDLVASFGAMLNNNIYDENNDLRTLKVGKKGVKEITNLEENWK